MNAKTHLIVDGSNLMHAWPDTRALARRDREAARALLLRRLAALHDAGGWRVTVVFDGRGDSLQIEPVAGADDFACIYTPAGTTADDVIEQLVARSLDPSACLVTTADRAERCTVEAAGAAWCSPEDMASRIDAQDTRRSLKVSALRSRTEKAWRGEGGAS